MPATYPRRTRRRPVIEASTGARRDSTHSRSKRQTRSGRASLYCAGETAAHSRDTRAKCRFSDRLRANPSKKETDLRKRHKHVLKLSRRGVGSCDNQVKLRLPPFKHLRARKTWHTVCNNPPRNNETHKEVGGRSGPPSYRTSLAVSRLRVAVRQVEKTDRESFWGQKRRLVTD